ncbi:uncharacterized protein LOC133307808 [Gastrolobium bilobum]|uniref:uncharacterized protein LOC133307808 n=1 Tax=Gastrolobium bilobum TaxID=150636 RepID=UPI002AAF8FE2|nr:uncharacterized protein LOC133307808 [Gastrolobium bilobum]
MANQSSDIDQENVTNRIPIVTDQIFPSATHVPIVDDPSNPGSTYYVHPNENPSLVLVSSLMDGKNYHNWARSMKMALISKNKLSFVNGTISVPDPSDPYFAAWERCNTMVLSWLHHSITQSISQSILWMDRASDVWNDLRERFSQSDIFKISDLQDEIYRMHQGDSSISDYYTRLKILWDELEALQPTPTCKCIKPCCSIALKVRSIRERDYSIRFLKGLNERFSHVRSQVMLMDPLPSINRVFSMVIQQERQLQLEGNSLNFEGPKTFYNSADQGRGRSQPYQARGRGRGSYVGRGRTGSNRLCTYCGRTSHTAETCFEKHGYSPGFKQRNTDYRPSFDYRPNVAHKANVVDVN